MRKMKSWKVIVILLFSSAFIVSCENEKNNEVETNNEISEDLTAKTISNSLVYQNFGLTAVLNYLSQESKEIIESIECDKEGRNSDTINYSSCDGKVTSVFEYEQTYSKTCTPEIALNYKLDANHLFETNYFSVDNQIDFDGNLSGLDETNENFIFKGTYNLNGLWKENISNKKINVKIKMSFDRILLNKEKNRINSGKIDFEYQAGIPNTFIKMSLEGSISILNEYEAIIYFDSGSKYSVNLATGEIKEIQ